MPFYYQGVQMEPTDISRFDGTPLHFIVVQEGVEARSQRLHRAGIGANDQPFLTRAGSFVKNGDGELINAAGFRLLCSDDGSGGADSIRDMESSTGLGSRIIRSLAASIGARTHWSAGELGLRLELSTTGSR